MIGREREVGRDWMKGKKVIVFDPPPCLYISYYLPKLEQSSRVKHSTTSTTLTHTHSEREHSAYHLAQLHIVYIETKLVLSAEKSKICPQISTQLSYDSITE